MSPKISLRSLDLKCLNSTFILMVPKKGEAEDLKDFRPITLTNSSYKLIAKVFANILKSVKDHQSTTLGWLLCSIGRLGLWFRGYEERNKKENLL